MVPAWLVIPPPEERMTTTRSVLARTVRGAGWVIAWRLGVRVLGLISTLILVRLLVPADFGLLALARRSMA
jgi:O-antigen/teichoic acid export membrane protein